MNSGNTLVELVARDPYAGYLGVRVADQEGDSPGGPLAVFPDLLLGTDEQHIGNRHTLGMHGGVVAGFLELAGRLHVCVATGRAATALTFTCEFLREIRDGEVRARTEIVRTGRRLAVARITAWTDDPLRPVATGHGSFALDPG